NLLPSNKKIPHNRNARSNVKEQSANGVLIARVAAARWLCSLGERSRMNADLHGRIRRMEGQVSLDHLQPNALEFRYWRGHEPPRNSAMPLRELSDDRHHRRHHHQSGRRTARRTEKTRMMRRNEILYWRSWQ